MNPLDAVTFDVSKHALEQDSPGLRVWRTPAGDALGLFHFAAPPDIGAPLSALAALRAFYRADLERAGFGVVEIELRTVDRCPAVRIISKMAHESGGRIYLASLTFPFRDFSYVLKLQCNEHGITGIRDTAVLMTMMGDGAVTVDDETGEMQGWADDPYDPELRGPLVRNRSERVEHDAEFPEHPLSRARERLDALEKSLRIAASVRDAAPFTGPGESD